jgi:hypothetical protein
MKTQEFLVGYGDFHHAMIAEQICSGVTIASSIELEHRKTIKGVLVGSNRCIKYHFEIAMITGKTPSTYYSGNRRYGKYVFMVPEEILVVESVYQGDSNEKAFQNNKSSLKLYAHGAQSIGYDFFYIDDVYNGEAKFQTLQKLKLSHLEGFGVLDDIIFIKHAMPVNLPELIPGFPHQTQGWKRNQSTTHLHLVYSIRDTHCKIFFAAPTADITPIEDVSTMWIKCLSDSHEDILDDERDDILNDE